MKNRLFSIAVLLVAFAATPKAQAFVGGPFDNDDYSILLDRDGVYQATFSFSNGSGMAMFSQDNSFEPASATSVAGQFALHNRSVFYYKGVTYFGTCTGIIDHGAKKIIGFTNGNSDYSAGAATPAGRPAIGANGLNFTANSEFKANITTTAPILRFKGKGTVTFMGVPQIATLRAAAAAAIAAIGVPVIIPPATTVTTAQASQYINTVLALTAQVDNPSTVEAYQENQTMRVYGSRRYF